MNHRDGGDISGEPTIELLARAIQRHAHKAGDHLTALPAPSLHRRDAPTEPMRCICDFGLAVTTQGTKQVMVGDKIFFSRSRAEPAGSDPCIDGGKTVRAEAAPGGQVVAACFLINTIVGVADRFFT